MTLNNEHTAMIDLLFRLADDELLIGHRNSEWTGVAPMLEEDIAFSSLAQDEMGHAQAYYTILHEHFGQENPDRLAFLRDPATFRNAELTALPRNGWAEALMRQFLYDSAEQVRLARYIEHPFAPLAQLARKIRGEEKYHFLHGRTWLLKLGNATEESRAYLQTALDNLWGYALGLFEPTPHDQDAPFDEDTLREDWLGLVTAFLTEAGLKVDANAQPIYGRYAEPSNARVELLDAMQVVYRIDPEAEW